MSAILLTEPFFRTFNSREICGTTVHTEASLALTCRRAEVDEMVRAAVAAGGKPAVDPQDYGFMSRLEFLRPGLGSPVLGKWGLERAQGHTSAAIGRAWSPSV